MTRSELSPVVVPLRASRRVLIKRAALGTLAFVLLVPLTPLLAWIALEIGTRVADLFFDRRTDQHEWTSLLISMLTVPAAQVSIIACLAWLGRRDRKRKRQRKHESEIISMARSAAQRRATLH
jgi:hypothetical protein